MGFLFRSVITPKPGEQGGSLAHFSSPCVGYCLGNVYLLLKLGKIITGNIISSTKRAKHSLTIAFAKFC